MDDVDCSRGSGRPPSGWDGVSLESQKLLMAASSGGHLAELLRVISLTHPHTDSLIVTFDSPQSRALRAEHRIEFIPYIRPRDLRGVVHGLAAFSRLIHAENGTQS